MKGVKKYCKELWCLAQKHMRILYKEAVVLQSTIFVTFYPIWSGILYNWYCCFWHYCNVSHMNLVTYCYIDWSEKSSPISSSHSHVVWTFRSMSSIPLSILRQLPPVDRCIMWALDEIVCNKLVHCGGGIYHTIWSSQSRFKPDNNPKVLNNGQH